MNLGRLHGVTASLVFRPAICSAIWGQEYILLIVQSQPILAMF